MSWMLDGGFAVVEMRGHKGVVKLGDLGLGASA